MDNQKDHLIKKKVERTLENLHLSKISSKVMYNLAKKRLIDDEIKNSAVIDYDSVESFHDSLNVRLGSLDRIFTPIFRFIQHFDNSTSIRIIKKFKKEVN